MLKTVPGLVQQLGPGKQNFRNNIQTTPWQGGGVAGGGQARAGHGNWFQSMFPVTNAVRGSVILAQNEIAGEGGGGPNRLKRSRRRGGQKPGGGPCSCPPGLPGSEGGGGLTPGQKDYNPVDDQTQGTANAGNPVFMGGAENGEGSRASGVPMYTNREQTELDQALEQSYGNDAEYEEWRKNNDDVVGDTVQDDLQPLPPTANIVNPPTVNPTSNIFDDARYQGSVKREVTGLSSNPTSNIFQDPKYQGVKKEDDDDVFYDADEPQNPKGKNVVRFAPGTKSS